MKILNNLLNNRFVFLIIKEINQILRDKPLIIFLLFPPTIQLLLYGFALNPDVHNLKLGIMDYSQTYESREFISALTENNIFVAEKYILNYQDLGESVQQGKITSGLVISPDFKRKISENKPAEVQVLVDGMDANTAGIINGYINQIVEQYNRKLEVEQNRIIVQPQTVFLYNPGLISSWFFVPAMIGVILTIISSIVSAGTVVREKDIGTLEQLMLTPAGTWEILLAKIVPLFLLLMGDVVLALGVAKLVFKVPFNGDIILFLLLSGIYVFGGISIGIMLATIANTQQQTFLLSFFVNFPFILLSGSFSPIENTPQFIQYLSMVNPLRHYVVIVRGIMLKGVGLEVLWPNAAFILLFATGMLLISIKRFRSQLV
ncbi:MULTISPECIES: ABC transporter permease [unclassified Nostoc]|uniref:ABC transporter permease n=1 Tax=unclassified Nostoc TaxID=2593658 RepID=UPI002AD3D8D7|nr:ABC transporter permease [Nostoc sp. DedQUE03]MDZ7975144.1 ABC transporter permease [Nostoc sp. DedQUE03]MDZ8045674.1 ABC transporter permease [Nostoc sp. DedQUE02]